MSKGGFIMKNIQSRNPSTLEQLIHFMASPDLLSQNQDSDLCGKHLACLTRVDRLFLS